jgi:hypothetical protein
LAEIEMETTRGRATDAEVKEAQADLERFEKWLTGIGDGSYFKTAGGAEAGSAVQRCREAEAALRLLRSLPTTPTTKTVAFANSRLRIVKDQLWPIIRGLRC